MSVVLHDPARIARLRASCRRTGQVRRRRWWQLRRWARDGGDALVYRGVFHVAMITALVHCAHLAGRFPEEAQALAFAGLLCMHARIFQLHFLLHGDVAFAVLARLPVPAAALAQYQLRQGWRALLWPGVHATVFWYALWAGRGGDGPWLWLPVVAAAHAALTEALALFLLRRWPLPGWLVFGAVMGIAWVAVKPHGHPLLWPCVQPVLETVAWITPWGWLNGLAYRLPQEGLLCGLGVLGLGGIAGIALHLGRARMLRRWTLDPRWAELAGRPAHTWEAPDEDEEDARLVVLAATGTDTLATCGAGTGAADAAADGRPDEREAAARAALQRSRAQASGLSLMPLGWAGRRVLARCDADDRWLIDRLAPRGSGDVAWRWGLLLAALPAACALAQVSALWGLGTLAAILALRRMTVRAVLVAALAGGALMLPSPLHQPVGILTPCAAAILMTIPLFGGTWGGLPLSCAPLGALPRSWWRLMRLMLLTTGFRLLAGLPIVALAVVACGRGLEIIAGMALASGLLVVGLALPWVTALLLIQRSPGGLDVGLGSGPLTFFHGWGVVVWLIAGGLMLTGSCFVFVEEEISSSALISVGAGIALAAVTTAVQIPLLRRAYRRRVDFVLRA